MTLVNSLYEGAEDYNNALELARQYKSAQRCPTAQTWKPVQLRPILTIQAEMSTHYKRSQYPWTNSPMILHKVLLIRKTNLRRYWQVPSSVRR